MKLILDKESNNMNNSSEINISDLKYRKNSVSEAVENEDPFYLCNMGTIVEKWNQFKECLPQVEPFYAVKCNPDSQVLSLMANLGASFDCASKGELQAILDCGVSPERIVYANPCKQQSHIKYAASKNVKMMTFDNEVELHKIKKHFPGAKLIIRIRVDDSGSLCKLGIKFGVCPTEARDLLKCAKELELDVIGVSFHVGSGCQNAQLFYNAVKLAKQVFADGEAVGYNFHLLDIGGGFPGCDTDVVSFDEVAIQLKLALYDYFPCTSGIRIIAEPGRFFVASAFTLVTTVISVREVQDENVSNKGYMYYINEGVYAAFNCIMFDHQRPKPLVKSYDPQLYQSSVWGPTCDSIDRIVEAVWLPKLSVGDRVVFENMGAYTIAAASTFNGFQRTKVFYTNSDPWMFLKEIGIERMQPLISDLCRVGAEMSADPFFQLTDLCKVPPAVLV